MKHSTETTSPSAPSDYSIAPSPVTAARRPEGRLPASLFRRLSLPFWAAIGFTLISTLLSIIGIGYASFYHQNAGQAFSGGLSIALGFIAGMAVCIYLLLSKYLAQIERIEAERDLAVERLRAIENSMLRGEGLTAVSAGIAHDFKNLLIPFTMGFDLLEREELDTQPRRLLGVMKNSLEQAYRMIDELLEFGNASGRHVAYLPIQLRELLNGYRDMMAPQLPPGIQLEVTLQEGLPVIMANAEQILQVLQHLVLNSSEAIDAGEGRITLLAEAREHKGVPSVALSVTDTGVGIKPEVLPQVFTPFFTTKSRGRGTGMGLAIVRGIIRGHRGSIDIQSKPGQGTTVTLFFPVPMAT